MKAGGMMKKKFTIGIVILLALLYSHILRTKRCLV